MNFATKNFTIYLTTLSACATLVACGGGGGSAADSGATQIAAQVSTSTSAASAATIPATVATPAAPVAATGTTTTPTATSAAITSSAAITDVRLQNTDAGIAQTNVPFTFGQVFVQGQVKATDVLVGRLEDGATVALQMDVKATHADGSVRHAIISGILPSVAAGSQRTMTLATGGVTAANASVATISGVSRAGVTASFHAKIDGVDYYASADELLKAASSTSWLKGAIATEWQVAAPLRNAAGQQHPHLSARFAVRWYDAVQKARVDVTVENDWAYEPSPQNFTYDAEILVGGKSMYKQAALNHLHHARWRKVFWFNGSEPALNIKQNTAYLISTGALPNYDQSLVIPENALSAFQTRWNGVGQKPMESGLITAYMPMTGGRDDIGLLPNWAATWLLSQDSRMRDITLRTADLAGSFSSHYRDKLTGRPVSLADYPYMTINGRSTDTRNPATGKYEAFPGCAANAKCDTPYTHDASHQPNLAYLPYLATGDYYYLEELQFWGMWNAFQTNPGYRENVKGLLSSEQVRGQAWAMRTLAEAAYISPDKDSLKTAFNNIVNNNLDWYNGTYANNVKNVYSNTLGVITNGYAMSYEGGTAIAPWQDDFFTSAMGHAADLGFTKANAILGWKAQFPINRMVDAAGCWIDAAIYDIRIRNAENAPFFSTYAEAYASSHTSIFSALACGSSAMASALGLKAGEMTGYADGTMGYPSNMQPALAYAATVGGADGKRAWDLFMARSVKPDYRYAPQFAIVPR